LLEGKSGIKKISTFDVSQYRTQIAGEIIDVDLKNFINGNSFDRMDRFSHLGVVASKMALEDSGFDREMNSFHDAAVYIGSSVGGMMYFETQFKVLNSKGPRQVHPNSVPSIMPSSVSANIALELNLKGPNLTISTACSSSAHAIGLALDGIRSGKFTIALAGGAEAPISPGVFSGFDSLRAMSRNNEAPSEACKPFDYKRDGFVLGEGAAILILEEFESAKRRNARIYAEILGYGASNGAYHMVIPNPSGEDARRSMVAALLDADIDSKSISYISAHGTGTQLNDKIESEVIKNIFTVNSKKIAISSIKSTIGHTLGAAAAFGVVSCVMSIKNGWAPPTINYLTPDSDCDLDYIPNVARKLKIDYALSNSFGFGNNNGCIVVGRIDA
jgi:3-oxoacyl-[acyl-carrier-protein] synthase II